MTLIETRKMVSSILFLAAISSAIAIGGCHSKSKGGLCGENGTDLTQFVQEATEKHTGTFTGHFENYPADEDEVSCPHVGIEYTLTVEMVEGSMCCIGDEDVHGAGAEVSCDDYAEFGTWDLTGSLETGEDLFPQLEGNLEIIACSWGPGFYISLRADVQENEVIFIGYSGAQEYPKEGLEVGDKLGWSRKVLSESGYVLEVLEGCRMTIEHHEPLPVADGGV